ncbi:MAG: DEAD/DEAH box helicase, partial [Candidatus Thorarchaeota archaeon]
MRGGALIGRKTFNRGKSQESPVLIGFRGDDLVLSNLSKVPPDMRGLPHTSERDFFRFLPCDFSIILQRLKQAGYDVELGFFCDFALTFPLTPTFRLRNYQEQAISHWKTQGEGRGTVILPTGGGKTIIGLAAIHLLNVRTLVIVPTLDLVDQWISRFTWFEEFSSDSRADTIGQYGGGSQILRALTVSTYESARLYSKRLRNEFGLLIFDEVHHLSGERWSDIARAYIAPYRLGLTATLSKQDIGYEPVVKYVGPIVFSMAPSELKERGAIASYQIKKILVDLDSDQQAEYDGQVKIYRNYMRQKNLYGKKGYQQLLYRYREPKARQALQAHRLARKIAFNAPGKLQAIHDIFQNHPEEKILLFCESIPFVEEISMHFLIPAISSNLSSQERQRVLELFSHGKIRVLAAGRVLDEGLDVADASIGIIISGSA